MGFEKAVVMVKGQAAATAASKADTTDSEMAEPLAQLTDQGKAERWADCVAARWVATMAGSTVGSTVDWKAAKTAAGTAAELVEC